MREVCFLDLDGVLADFIAGMSAVHNKPYPYEDEANWGIYHLEKLWGISTSEFWVPANTLEFWTNLKPTAECFDLVEMAEHHFGRDNVAILTSPSRAPESVAGKLLWVREHLPEYERRLLIGAPKHLCAHEGAYLIDDSDYKIDRFSKRGGNGVLFPRPWNRNHPHAHDPLGFVAKTVSLSTKVA